MAKSHVFDVATALKFLKGLRDHNDRAWFAANRGVYDETIKPQWEDLVAALAIAATAFDQRFAYVDPRRCIFRIYRDVRFSNDKSPYKPRVSAFLSPRGWRGTTPGFYLAIEPGGESHFGAGIYVPEKPHLQAIREALAAGDRDFDRVRKGKQLAPYLPLDLDPLQRMPRGFEKDHPRGDFIRARRMMVSRSFTDKELRDGDVFAIVKKAMADTAPLVAWLDGFVTTPQHEPDEWREE